ncbi:helix-turn-helix domain-containing protein [Enterococcus casseliflavus]|uniref:helix-turn-helix domain-containing protein n=1 Tax=Enterococcus casseliflavus TaxID=37734 RepID=UPI003EE14529
MRILTSIENESLFTIFKLSEHLAISQRTVIKDIQAIQSYFEETIELLFTNDGFRLAKRDLIGYLEKKDTLLENEILFEIISFVFYGQPISLSDMANRYNCEESMLRHYFDEVEPILNLYGLTLSLNPVRFHGEEANIKKFFFDFYYSK